MAIESIGTSRSYLTKQLVSLKGNLTEKTSQLASGKVSQTYGGLGDNRLLDLELNQKVNRISSYQETITQVNLHIKSLNVTLERLEDLRLDTKSALDLNDYELQNDGQTRTQATAEVLLHEAISLLNTEVAGYYLYGGTDAYENPVADVDSIMEGSGDRAGLKQVMNEYIAANLGSDKLGRLEVPALVAPTASTITITEDGAHDFGLKLSSVTSDLANASITQPTGAIPDSLSIEFTGQPDAGQKISIEFTLPPGHTKPVSFELEADTTGEGADTFVIGADTDETAANLRAKILEKIEEQANTSLKAAASEWAGDQFFDTFGGATPMRVDGPPFESATALTSGASTTVEWYVGENTSTTDARRDKNARIDDNLNVSYGARANEKGLSDVMKSLATFVAADFSTDVAFTGSETPEQKKEMLAAQERIDKLHYGEFVQRFRSVVQPDVADQSGIVDISTEISIAFRTVQDTDSRHTQMKSTYSATIDEIEGVDKELLAVEILQLQTNLEASYRASSIVFNLNLADYI